MPEEGVVEEPTLDQKMDLAIKVFSNRTLARNVTLVYIGLFSVMTILLATMGIKWYIVLAAADFVVFITSYTFFTIGIPRLLRYYATGE